MPTHKTEILGSIIEINYEENEKNKLLKIISQFNDRLSDFKNLQGKISDNKILFLTALKAEDKIDDLINQIAKNKENHIKKNEQSLYQNELTKEIIKLKDKVKELNIESERLANIHSIAFEELDKIEIQLNNFTNKIFSLRKNDD